MLRALTRKSPFMRQHQFESAVARATGESVRTIRLRGFSLIELDPCGRSSRDRNPKSSASSRQLLRSNPTDPEVFADGEI